MHIYRVIYYTETSTETQHCDVLSPSLIEAMRYVRNNIAGFYGLVWKAKLLAT